MDHHLLVLGWNDSGPAVIEEFVADPRYAQTPVVLVADLEASPIDDRAVRFVRGQPTHRSTLERAGARDAAIAIVLARDPSDAVSDMQTALAVSVFRRLNSGARVSAQLVDPANREVVEEARCDAIVSPSLVVSAMLVRGVQDLGALEVVHDLVSSRGGSQIYRVSIPARLVGHSFRECALALMERRALLVALVRAGEIVTNPDANLRLEPDDDAFVISQTPPVLK